MIDIIPAAAFDSGMHAKEMDEQGKSADQKLEVTLKEEKNLTSPPLDTEKKGEIKPPKKKRPWGAYVGFIALILVLIAGVLVGYIQRDTIAKLFSTSDAGFTDDEKKSFGYLDEDNDGLTTLEEMASGTLVLEPDTDGDELPDGYEVQFGLNPLDPADALYDQDKDDLKNIDEYYYETNISDPDTDNDGFKDGSEVKDGYNPKGTGALKKPQKDGVPVERVSSEGMIKILTGEFNPEFIRIKEGDSLTFVNEDTVTHFVTGPEIETDAIQPGSSFTISFQKEGVYEFYDRDDARYKGKIIVEKMVQNDEE
ncbi:cupredoxin domain-containing protein [Patescibacteria group bacterium]|nr:cupredoxin domain-containing protein [Patescibacteria group bacterium]